MLWEESSSVHTKGGRDKLVGARGKRQSQSVGCRFACIVDCGLWLVAKSFLVRKQALVGAWCGKINSEMQRHNNVSCLTSLDLRHCLPYLLLPRSTTGRYCSKRMQYAILYVRALITHYNNKD